MCGLDELANMKTADNKPLCAKFQRGKCDKPVYGGGCAGRGQTLMHLCACIIDLAPGTSVMKLCLQEHPANQCERKAN